MYSNCTGVRLRRCKKFPKYFYRTKELPFLGRPPGEVQQEKEELHEQNHDDGGDPRHDEVVDVVAEFRFRNQGAITVGLLVDGAL